MNEYSINVKFVPRKLEKEYPTWKRDLTFTFSLRAFGQPTSFSEGDLSLELQTVQNFSPTSFAAREAISRCTEETAQALKLRFVFFWKVSLVC